VSEAEQGARVQLGQIEQEKTSLEQQKATLEQENTALERKIDELRIFERDYRTKLRGYIEGQLRDLDGGNQLNDAATTGPASGTGAQPLPAGTQQQAPATGQQPTDPAYPAAAPAYPSAPAYPGAQPTGGYGAYGQPSEYQGFAGN